MSTSIYIVGNVTQKSKGVIRKNRKESL